MNELFGFVRNEEHEQLFIEHKGYPHTIFQVLDMDLIPDDQEIALKQQHSHFTMFIDEKQLLVIMADIDTAAFLDDNGFEQLFDRVQQECARWACTTGYEQLAQ